MGNDIIIFHFSLALMQIGKPVKIQHCDSFKSVSFQCKLGNSAQEG